MDRLSVADLKSLTQPELAYAVISQLATLCAVVANITCRKGRFKPEEFMIQLRHKAGTDTLRGAFEAVMEYTADIPHVISTAIKKAETQSNDNADDRQI